MKTRVTRRVKNRKILKIERNREICSSSIRNLKEIATIRNVHAPSSLHEFTFTQLQT